VNACAANTACVSILECAQTCGQVPEPTVCIEDCILADPSGRATFEPLITCITDTCFDACSGS
jgi:hypothetical protein